MAKRILFLTGPCGRDIWMWKIYQEMNKRERLEPHFIAMRQKDIDLLTSKGIKTEQITAIFSLVKGPKPDEDYLRKCEEKYSINIWDFWNINLARDKKRAKISREEVLSYFQIAFYNIEKIIKNFKPDYYICYGVAGYSTALFTEVLRQNKVNVMELASAIIPNRVTFLEDLSNIWPSLSQSYEEIRKKGLTQEEEKQAKQFIEDFRNRPKKPDCAKKFSEPFKNKIQRYTNYTKQVLRYRQLPSNLRFVFWPIIQKFYDSIGIFEKPKSNEGYVLFPLHFQPEATTLIYGKWYVDQAALIENLSKSIPVTYKLYVKEHPFGYGNRDLSFYKRIKRLPNVRLIGPHENTFELIKNCSLLATITGTAGWEALLFQKPVITFGDIFYNICEETKKVEKIEELPKIIRGRLDKKINYMTLVEFVGAMFKCSYTGLARLPSDCNDYSLEEENIKLLVKGIVDYINKKEN